MLRISYAWNMIIIGGQFVDFSVFIIIKYIAKGENRTRQDSVDKVTDRSSLF